MSDQKYGRVELVPDGMPSFVLLAKDAAALDALRWYRYSCQRIGSPEAHVAAIQQQIDRFRTWQKEHAGDVKVPV